MSVSLALVIVFIIASSWWVYSTHQKVSRVLLHLALLLSTPWIVVLTLSQPSLRPLPATQPKLSQVATNINYFSSFEFLFFSGDPRPGHGIIDSGVFLPSFLPLIALGLFTAVKRKKNLNYTFTIWWLIGGMIMSLTTSNQPVLSGSLWFLPSLSLLATSGLFSLIDLMKQKRQPIRAWQSTLGVSPWLFILTGISYVWFLWFGYETVRLYYILVNWQPFTV